MYTTYNLSKWRSLEKGMYDVWLFIKFMMSMLYVKIQVSTWVVCMDWWLVKWRQAPLYIMVAFPQFEGSCWGGIHRSQLCSHNVSSFLVGSWGKEPLWLCLGSLLGLVWLICTIVEIDNLCIICMIFLCYMFVPWEVLLVVYTNYGYYGGLWSLVVFKPLWCWCIHEGVGWEC